MPRYKLILILIFLILPLFAFTRCEPLSVFRDRSDRQAGRETKLPVWLSRTHRQSGPYNFDFIPLEIKDPPPGNTLTGQEPAAPLAESPSINPGGSPYPPGSLADMIWQQKQQDQRYGD